jgi:uncharacterized membrane protein
VAESNPTGLSDNAAAGIAYITFFPAIVFLVMPPYNASSFVRFHAWQSIFLNIAACVVWFLLAIITAVQLFIAPAVLAMLHLLVYLAMVLMWVICVLKAVNGKRFKLPLLGALAAKQVGE